MLFDWLFWCLSWLHASLDVFLLDKHLFWTLDRSSIVAQHLLDLSRILGFLDTSRQIAQSIEPLLWSLCLLDSCSTPPRSIESVLPSIPPRSIEVLFSTPPWYLFNLSRRLFLYIPKVWPGLLFTQIFRSFSLLARPKHLLLSKSSLPIKISALSKHQSFGKCS